MKFKPTIAILCIWLIAGCSAIVEEVKKPPKNQSLPELHRVSYHSFVDGKPRDFYLYLPKNYHSNNLKKWPVILYLHGNGARGDGKKDLKWVTKYGPLSEAWVQKRDLPFVIIAPQLHMFGRDTVVNYIANRDSTTIPKRLQEGVPSRPPIQKVNAAFNGQTISSNLPYGEKGNAYGWPEVETDLMAILDTVEKNYRVEKKQIYLTGISYGAYGTWYIGSQHTHKFAALAPISGWGHPNIMQNLAQANTPIWCYAGGKDNIVPVKYFYPGLNQLEKFGHKNVRFTIEADLGHDAWKRVYAGKDLYEWLLEQKLP